MEKSNGMIHESGSREGARECYQELSKAVLFPRLFQVRAQEEDGVICSARQVNRESC